MKTLLALIVVCGTSGMTSSIRAQELITSIVSHDPFDFRNPITIGYAFATGENPLTITGLGMWDDQQDGFASDVGVGLWSEAGTLFGLVSVPVGVAGTLINEYRYIDLDMPLTLSADTAYVLGAFRRPGVAYNALNFGAGRDFLVDPNFTHLENRGSSKNGGENELIFPEYVFDETSSFAGPNLRYSTVAQVATVPEPEITWIIWLAIMLLPTRRCRSLDR